MINKKLPSIKKNIGVFLSSEEGKISKKSALDLGIGIVALALLLGRVATSDAITSHISHGSHGSHGSCHGNHGSHGSCHGNHSSGGGCHPSFTT